MSSNVVHQFESEFSVDLMQFYISVDVARCDSAIKQLYKNNSAIIQLNSVQVPIQ